MDEKEARAQLAQLESQINGLEQLWAHALGTYTTEQLRQLTYDVASGKEPSFQILDDWEHSRNSLACCTLLREVKRRIEVEALEGEEWKG